MKTTDDIKAEAERVATELVEKGFTPLELLMVFETAKAVTVSFIANLNAMKYEECKKEVKNDS